ncbi:MAG TPA: DUF167 domain-containing protein [Patescibacteria group bacterium]|nr:DUF167 domain-containing protein [Patescibacteria group bacterium]
MRDIKSRKDGRVGFRVRIRPSAPRSELLGWNTAGELRVHVAAPPVEGAANKKLIAFLAKQLKLSKSDIRIEAGESSRVKTLSIPDSARGALDMLPDI